MRDICQAALLFAAFILGTLAEENTSIRLLKAEDPDLVEDLETPARRRSGSDGPAYSNTKEYSKFPVTIGLTHTLGFTGHRFTASAWIYRTGGGSGDYAIFGTDQRSRNRGLHLTVRKHRFHLGFYANDCGNAGTSKRNQWQHVAFIFDNGAMEIFVDGARVGRCTGKSRFQGHGPVQLGQWGGGHRFVGKIKQAKVWKRVLSPHEIKRESKQNTACDFTKQYYEFIAEIGYNLKVNIIDECKRMAGQIPKYLEMTSVPEKGRTRADLCPCLEGLGPNFIKKNLNCDITLHGHRISLLELWEKNCKEHPTCKWSAVPRGAGYPLTDCPRHKVKMGLLCYDRCPSGYYRAGFECVQRCPHGWRDDGLYCRRAEYGRGAGYAAWDWNKCVSENPHRGCEWDGWMIYPKCKPGYEPSGCCICRPKPFNCKALGFHHQLDISCAKYIKPGNPTPMICRPGLEWGGAASAGLCYDPCSKGYKGVGPVCHRRSDCDTQRPDAGYACYHYTAADKAKGLPEKEMCEAAGEGFVFDKNGLCGGCWCCSPNDAEDDGANAPTEGSNVCGGTAPEGAECMFPFVYKGVSYDSCTDVNHDQAWCYTNQEFTQWRNCNCGPRSIVDNGGEGCTRGRPCGLCEGDCDEDADCAGSLRCFHRSNGGEVPGCRGAGSFSQRSHDFCYDPSK